MLDDGQTLEGATEADRHRLNSAVALKVQATALLVAEENKRRAEDAKVETSAVET